MGEKKEYDFKEEKSKKKKNKNNKITNRTRIWNLKFGFWLPLNLYYFFGAQSF